MTPEIKKKRDELRPKDLHFRKECANDYSCGAHKSWDEGFDAAWAIQQERIGILRTAIRQALGWFALWNDEKDQKKWPKYIKTCEQALEQDAKLARGEHA